MKNKRVSTEGDLNMSNSVYSKEIKTESNKEFYQEMMKLEQTELSKPDNKKRKYAIHRLMKNYKNKGVRIMYKSEMGANTFIKNGKKYYLYTNFLVEQRKGDNVLRIVYLVKSGGDTIKLAVEKCKYLGIEDECRVYLEGMNLRTAVS